MEKSVDKLLLRSSAKASWFKFERQNIIFKMIQKSALRNLIYDLQSIYLRNSHFFIFYDLFNFRTYTTHISFSVISIRITISFIAFLIDEIQFIRKGEVSYCFLSNKIINHFLSLITLLI